MASAGGEHGCNVMAYPGVRADALSWYMLEAKANAVPWGNPGVNAGHVNRPAGSGLSPGHIMVTTLLHRGWITTRMRRYGIAATTVSWTRRQAEVKGPPYHHPHAKNVSSPASWGKGLFRVSSNDAVPLLATFFLKI